ncbi:MAG TPA: hypothetical protein VLZ83_11680 [Edaphocola sp.]|nr:hypothetical protein [Edaphocola sp.]
MYHLIIFAVATGLFALAMVFNMNVLQSNNAGDVSLESIAVMAQAQANPESGWDAFKQGIKDWWNSEIYDCDTQDCLIDFVIGYGPVYGTEGYCTGGSSVAHCISCFKICS